jgi:hypothetical protein
MPKWEFRYGTYGMVGIVWYGTLQIQDQQKVKSLLKLIRTLYRWV